MKFESGLNNLGVVAEVAGGGIPTRAKVERLIHDRGDCGLVMIAEGWLTAKSYGKDILESLPPMLVTNDGETTKSLRLTYELAIDVDDDSPLSWLDSRFFQPQML